MAVLGALGDLVLALSADTAKFQSDLGRAQRVADKFGREVGRTLGNLAGMLLALGGAAGFGALVKGQIDAADEALRLSQQVGLSVEQLSAYQVAARLADVSNEQLTVGLRQLSKNQAEFVAGSGEAADAFRALGITQEQVNAMNGDTAALFELVVGKLSSFEDGANKTAIAMKIFGRSGAELIPLINEFEKTRKEAAALNAIIDKDTAASADRFNDNLTRVGVAVRAVGLNIARAVLPTLEQLSERMVAAAKDTEAMDRAGRVADTGLRLLATGGTIVSTIFTVLGKTLGAVAAGLVLLAQGKFREAFHAVREGGWDMAKDVSAAVTSIGKTWDDAAKDIKGKAPETAKKLAAPGLISAEMIEKARKDMADAINRQHDEAMATIEADKEILKQQHLVNASFVESAQLSQEAAEGMVYTWDQAGNRIEITREAFDELAAQQKKNQDFAKNLGLTFTSAFEDAIVKGERFSDVLKGLEQDIARIILRRAVTEPMANAIGAGLAAAIPGIFGPTPARAMGGPVDSGMPYIVGERGPELFVPDGGGRVVPNGMGAITIHQSIHVDSRADQATIVLAMRRAKDEAVAEIRHLQQSRGDSRV